MTREHDLEIGSLLKDRWYLILKPVTDSDAEGFKVTAYDTTPMPDPNDEYLEAGVVAQQGIMELLENDLERVMEAGLARLSFNDFVESVEEELDTPEDRLLKAEGNVLKVDFGVKQ
ncbi:MAG: hypothetical protein CMI60_09800 [Parvibaculum sp.]|nr:hypothetical protein [Parvibaculum sp.]